MGWVRRELAALGIPALKRFGQHFLVDKGVREELIVAAELNDNDVVLEVGPGLGFLTDALVHKAGRVISVEKDRTLASYLTKKFFQQSNLTVIQGDALKVEIPPFTKIVTSPPYNISSKLILLILKSQIQLAALLLQDEFARRLSAPTGSQHYGRLTVMFQSCAQAEYRMRVPPSSFYPKPKIDSALVRITPAKQDPPIANAALFEDMIRYLFTQRRRLLKNVLEGYLENRYPDHSEAIRERISVPEKRIFEMSPTELANLSNSIADALSEAQRGPDSIAS